MDLLEIKNISKKIWFRPILQDVTASFKKGTVTALVGKNGSGKTMLLRILAGLVQQNSGEILIDGKNKNDLSKQEAPIIGLTIEHSGLYPQLTAYQNLELLARVRNIIKKDEIYDSIQRVGLDPKDNRPTRKYSLGMRQRLLIAQAIMEKPDLLLLDEPTSALDEEGSDKIRSIMREEADRGAIVIIASHSKEDIRVCCDSVCYMKDGILTVEREGAG
ncbi:SkfA peptide export ATP-binding protein SkfE [Clostridiales bacterium CHKCI001]|nr:SkfA peptide export ATP-binding protein SkfE [Clostridiales bacterium CHKCI001]